MAIVAERNAGSGGSPAIDALTEVSATFGNWLAEKGPVTDEHSSKSDP
jgi:hypothetical protein